MSSLIGLVSGIGCEDAQLLIELAVRHTGGVLLSSFSMSTNS